MNKNLRKRKIKILMKIANNNSGEDLIFAMRSVSKETGTPMLVLKELYEDYPEEMEKVLFPEVPKYEKITGIVSGLSRPKKVTLDVKTMHGIHIVRGKANISPSTFQDTALGGWPFNIISKNKQNKEDFEESTDLGKKYFQGHSRSIADQKEYRIYLSKLKGYEKVWSPPLVPGFDITDDHSNIDQGLFGKEHANLLYGTRRRGTAYLVPIGCSYYFIPIITKTGKPIVVKIPGGPSENTFFPVGENSTGIGYNLIVGSRKDLNPYFKNTISGINGCDIGKKKKINKKEEIEKLKERILTTYDNEPKPEDDPRVEESPHGDQGFGKIEYFAYKGMSPVNYKQFSYDPKSHSSIIHKSVLQKIKQKDPILHAKLMNQKMSNQNENSPSEDYFTKKEIDDIAAKYSGGGLLESPNIKLEYDVGDEITPDGKHIEKSLYPNLETKYK